MVDKIEVFVFIDALGWKIVGRDRFAEDLLPYRKPAEMQFGYSCTAIPTILTGKRPDEHGHLAFFSYAPDRSPFKRLAKWSWLFRPKSFWNRGRVRSRLSRIVKRLYGFTGYFQLYRMPIEKLGMMDYCERRDIFAAGGLAPCENLKDVMDRSSVPCHLSDWRAGDAANFEAAVRAIRGGSRFLFCYFCELDAILHDHAAELDHPAVRDKIAWYRERLAALAEACRATGREFSITVFSDHGMTPLAGTRDLMSAVEATGLVFGRDYGACYDSTMMRVTYLTEAAREKIPAALRPFERDGRWLDEAEMRRWGVWRDDRLFGDAIFLMNPGVQIAPSDMGQKPLNGMHGFVPDDRDSLAAVLSTEPIPDSVRAVSDYFGLMVSRLRDLEKSK